MSLETLLAVLGVAIALAGLTPYFLLNQEKHAQAKGVIVVSAITMLVLLTGITFVQSRINDHEIEQVALTIKAGLASGNMMTMEEFYDLVSHPQSPLVPAAVDRLVRRREAEFTKLVLYAPNEPDAGYPDRLHFARKSGGMP